MVVSLLAVTNRAVKRALPEVDPTQPAKLIPCGPLPTTSAAAKGTSAPWAFIRRYRSDAIFL
jgi:hypothetical protein